MFEDSKVKKSKICKSKKHNRSKSSSDAITNDGATIEVMHSAARMIEELSKV